MYWISRDKTLQKKKLINLNTQKLSKNETHREKKLEEKRKNEQNISEQQDNVKWPNLSVRLGYNQTQAPKKKEKWG